MRNSSFPPPRPLHSLSLVFLVAERRWTSQRQNFHSLLFSMTSRTKLSQLDCWQSFSSSPLLASAHQHFHMSAHTSSAAQQRVSDNFSSSRSYAPECKSNRNDDRIHSPRIRSFSKYPWKSTSALRTVARRSSTRTCESLGRLSWSDSIHQRSSGERSISGWFHIGQGQLLSWETNLFIILIRRFVFLTRQKHPWTMNTNKRLHYSMLASRAFPSSPTSISVKGQSTLLAEKYLLLLQHLREMPKDIRRSYAGSRTSMENLRKRILKARTLVLQCQDLCARREYDHCQILMQQRCNSIDK